MKLRCETCGQVQNVARLIELDAEAPLLTETMYLLCPECGTARQIASTEYEVRA